MGKRFTMLLASLFLCIGAALAQMKISGTVISSEDGQPVIGASVVVTGTGQGTVTNLEGQFTLTVPERAKLHISSAGMKAVDVTAKDNMRVVLEPLNTTLGEVVVTAMGIKRSAKALAFRPRQLKAMKLPQRAQTTLCRALQVRWRVCKYPVLRQTPARLSRLSCVVSARWVAPISRYMLSMACR